jgi:hypothetical protein
MERIPWRTPLHRPQRSIAVNSERHGSILTSVALYSAGCNALSTVLAPVARLRGTTSVREERL